MSEFGPAVSPTVHAAGAAGRSTAALQRTALTLFSCFRVRAAAIVESDLNCEAPHPGMGRPWSDMITVAHYPELRKLVHCVNPEASTEGFIRQPVYLYTLTAIAIRH